MKKTFKRALAMLLVVCMALPMFVMPVSAETTGVTDSGSYSNIDWVYKDKVLTLTANGGTALAEGNTLAWKTYLAEIEEVVVKNGTSNFTKINYGAFQSMTALKKVTIPASITSVYGKQNFNASGLKELVVEGNAYIPGAADLSNIADAGLSVTNHRVFEYTYIETLILPGNVYSSGKPIKTHSEADHWTKGRFSFGNSIKTVMGVYNDNNIDYLKTFATSMSCDFIPYGQMSNGTAWSYDEAKATLTVYGKVGGSELPAELPTSEYAKLTEATKLVIRPEITSVAAGAFAGLTNLTEVYYEGAKPDDNAFTSVGGITFYNSNAVSPYGSLLAELNKKIADGTATKVNDVYCIDNTQTATNIKAQIYNVDGEYWLYFSIDESVEGTYANNTIVMAGSTLKETENEETKDGNTKGWIYGGWGSGNNTTFQNQVWACDLNGDTKTDANDRKLITKAIIGDGITQIGHTTENTGDSRWGLVLGSLNGLETVEFADSCVNLYNSVFKNCTNLKTAYKRGGTPVIGTVDLTGFDIVDMRYYLIRNCAAVECFKVDLDVNILDFVPGNHPFYGNTALKEVTLPAGVDNITGDAETVLKNVEIIHAEFASAGCKFAQANNIHEPVHEGESGTVGTNGYQTYRVDHEKNEYQNTYAGYSGTSHRYDAEIIIENGNLTFNLNNKPGFSEVQWDNFVIWDVDTTKALVKTAKINCESTGEKKGSVDAFTSTGMFNGMTNLTTVQFVTDAETPYFSNINTGMFAGCSKLTTVYVGSEAEIPEAAEGIVDLSKFGVSYQAAKYKTMYKNMFKDCIAITRVILPERVKALATASQTNSPAELADTTFAGCTSLKTIELSAMFTTADSGADTSKVTSTCFPNQAGLQVVCPTEDMVTELNSGFGADGTEAITYGTYLEENVMNHDGYSVRFEKYNGLRTLYSFNNAFNNKYIDLAGYTLVEYGALLVAEKKCSDGIVTIDANGDPSVTGAIKQVVWNKDDENGGFGDRKILSDSNDDMTKFAVTLKNYSDYWDEAVWTRGYAIYEDANGTLVYVYVDYGKAVSLYDTLIAASVPAEDGSVVLNPEKYVCDEIAVWNVLEKGGNATVATTGDVDYMIIKDQNNDDVLVVRNRNGGVVADVDAVKTAASFTGEKVINLNFKAVATAE